MNDLQCHLDVRDETMPRPDFITRFNFFGIEVHIHVKPGLKGSDTLGKVVDKYNLLPRDVIRFLVL